MKKLWLRSSASLLLQRTRKREGQREAREGWGPGGGLKETNCGDDIYLVPTPTQSSLAFCTGVQFSRNSIRALSK